MARPKTKDELITLSQTNYTKLIDLVSSYTQEERDIDFPPGTMNRNITDILAHLHERHLMMLERYIVGMSGQKPAMPAAGYTRKTTPHYNQFVSIPKIEAKYNLQIYYHIPFYDTKKVTRRQ